MESLAAERFERRLTEEVSRLHLNLTEEMLVGFASIRQEMSRQRIAWIKWSLVFSMGQILAIASLFALMLPPR